MFSLFSSGKSLNDIINEGDSEEAMRLISKGIGVHDKSYWSHDTPLHIAAKTGQTTIIKELIAKGANCHSINYKNQYTPLHESVLSRNIECSRLLVLSSQINAKAYCQSTPLHLAVKNSDLEHVNLFLSNKVNVNLVNYEGETPLHISAKNNTLEITNILLEYSADPNIRDNKGNTPIHHSALNGNVGMTQSLLNYCADPNLINHNDEYPLYLAMSSETGTECTKLLFDQGNIKLNDISNKIRGYKTENSRLVREIYDLTTQNRMLKYDVNSLTSKLINDNN
jgi:ankyrin repeat protein